MMQLKAIKSGLVEDHNNYKKQRNKVNRMCRNAKRKKMNNDCDKYKGDSAKMWKVINESMNKKSKPNTYPDFVEARNADGDTVRIRDKKEIANVMNKQFVEMGAKLAEKLPPTTTKFSEYLNSLSIRV